MNPESKDNLKLRSQQKYAIDTIAANPLAASKARTLHMILREKSYRKMRGLSLYIPQPHQEDFHRSLAAERLVLGANRGMKTTCAAAEVAMAVTGTHPWQDYPKEDGRWICVAKDQTKIGEVMFRKLFKRGAYRIVFDKTTGYWRGWKPWRDGYDFRKTSPSLPLIPKELIRKIAWDKKALNCPKLVSLTNGWEISFFTSAGKPIEGVDVDGVWFDEEIYEGAWYSEMAARLLDRSGKFFWSATPQLATDILWNLHEEAMKLKGVPNARIEEFHFLLDDNPFIRTEDKDLLKAKYANNPDQYRVRILGQFLVASHRVYPNFSISAHCQEPFPISKDWTRYIVIDPGFVTSVALFFAVPPRNESQQVFLYDELYTHNADVKVFASRLHAKVLGQTFEAFLIDAHGSRRTEMGGKTIGQQYSEALAAKNIKSLSTGSNFIMIGEAGYTGHSSVNTGVQQVRSWLWNQDSGKPKLQVFNALCPEFCDEMRLYKNIVDKKTMRPQDKPDNSKYSHGPDCLRYAVMHGIPFVEPRRRSKDISEVMKYAVKRLKERREKAGGGSVFM